VGFGHEDAGVILDMSIAAASGYRSRSQVTRRITEQWAAENLYCASCTSSSLAAAPANTRAIDFTCPVCKVGYQLKAGTRWSERRVPDAGYAAMMDAIRSDEVPNLLLLQYSPAWRVQNLLLIPSFFFTAAAIQKRKPLSPTARRAGWVGCNIILEAIPDFAKLRLVDAGNACTPREVRMRYHRVRPLAKVRPDARGWTLDVLRAVQSLGRSDFVLDDVYALDIHFQERYPNNRHLRPKIRQQLQVLRDMGFVQFIGQGRYRMIG
jgi:type II restriction enzyme